LAQPRRSGLTGFGEAERVDGGLPPRAKPSGMPWSESAMAKTEYDPVSQLIEELDAKHGFGTPGVFAKGPPIPLAGVKRFFRFFKVADYYEQCWDAEAAAKYLALLAYHRRIGSATKIRVIRTLIEFLEQEPPPLGGSGDCRRYHHSLLTIEVVRVLSRMGREGRIALPVLFRVRQVRDTYCSKRNEAAIAILAILESDAEMIEAINALAAQDEERIRR
jgi:hypothetical protein